MGLINGTLYNLFNGVSQQAPALRLPTQAEAMDNFYPSLVDGLVKRPPTKCIVAVAGPVIGPKAKIDIINRDPGNQFIVVVEGNEVDVYDLDGNLLYFTAPPYLANVEPDQINILTVADYTFILNRAMTVQTMAHEVPSVPKGAIAFVKQASYDTTYTVELKFNTETTEPVTCSILTEKNFSDDGDPPPTVSSTDIAQQLCDLLNASEDVTANFKITMEASTIYIDPLDPTLQFSLKASDSRSNTQIYAVHDRIQEFSNLPTVAVRDFTVEVAGDENSSFDNYYVCFLPDDDMTDFGAGTWVETCKPVDNPQIPDPETMPHALIHHPDDTFTFETLDWEARVVGDDDSAPDPLFIGSTIADMFLYRDRLGILSDDNLTFSAASEFFRFYPETVITIVDSGPISLSAGQETVTYLKHAVPFQENLVVFAGNAQFNLPAADVLSPATATLKVSSTFDADLGAKPISTGETVIFCTRTGIHTGLREIYMDNDTLTRTTVNITSHVPAYIPGSPVTMCCSTTEDVLALIAGDDRSKLYVYKYYWSGNQKLQAAWFTFSFPDAATVVDAAFLESTLYLLLARPDGVYLESMDLSDTHLTEETPTAEVPLHLDRQAAPLQAQYDAGTDRTAMTFPYPLSGEEAAAYTLLDRETQRTVDFAYSEATDGTTVVLVEGDLSSDPERYIFGIIYDASFTFSEQFLRAGSSSNGGDQIVTQLGRLQFRRWAILYGASRYFRVVTKHQGGASYEYAFTGEFLNRPDYLLGTPALFRGKFFFPVKSVSDRVEIDIVNDSYLPCSIIGAEWEAFYTQRQQGRY